MGVDLLDITFRLERSFGIRMPEDWIARLGIVNRGDDATLGTLHRLVLAVCADQDVTAPSASWELVARAVEQATGFRGATPTTTLREAAPYG